MDLQDKGRRVERRGPWGAGQARLHQAWWGGGIGGKYPYGPVDPNMPLRHHDGYMSLDSTRDRSLGALDCGVSGDRAQR